MYSLFGPNQFNHTHKWTVNAATALLWHAICLRFDKHMSWLVIFLLERGWILPKRLKFEEHVLEQKLVKHVLQHAFGHTYAHPNAFISNSACEKTQCNSMPPRRKLSDLDRGRAIGWHNCTHTLVIRWNHIKIWDHSIQNLVFGTSVNSWSLTYFE